MPGSGIFDDLVEPAPAPAPAPVVQPPPVDAGPPSNIFADLVAEPVTSRDGDRVFDGVDHSNEHTEPDIGSRIGNTKAFGIASGLAPLVMGGPVGPLALAKETVGDRYGDMRANGHGVLASALAAAADGALFYAVPAAVGKGAAAIRAGLKLAEPATRLGAVAAHALEGGATGALLPEGSAAISAASGDPKRARAELESIPESALVGAGLGGLSGVATGPHAAEPSGLFSDLVASEPTNAGRGRTGVVDAPVAARDAAPAAVAGEAPPAPSGLAPAPAVVEPGDAHAPAERPAVGGSVPAEPASPEPAAAGAPVGIFADLVAPTPTPTTGSPALPEGADHGRSEQAPAAAAHVQGAPGESAAPARDAVPGEEADQARQHEAAGAAQAGQVGSDGVDRSHDVPLFGGTSEDGKTVYIDRNAPHTIGVNGKPADVDKYTAIHERAEKPLLDEGMSYAEAHDHATAVENAALRADGHDPAAYNAALKEHIDAAAAKSEPQTPPDIERKPYAESGVELPAKAQRVRPSSVESPAQGDLAAAKKRASEAWKRVQNLRARVKAEPIGGNRHGLRLELMRATEAHQEALRAARGAKEAIERRAQESGQTTKPAEESSDAAPREPQSATSSAAPIADERAAATRPDVAASAHEAAPAQREAVAAVGRGQAHGDILDAMIEEGGIEPRPKDLAAGAGEHDDRPKLTGKARAAYSGTIPPDQMAQRLQARGYGDGTVNTMHRLAREAQETRQAEPGQHAEDVLAHDSSAPPEANQRATSSRPDLAIPSENTPTREAFKAVDQQRTDAGKAEPVKDADIAKAAQDRLAADFDGEHAKIERKLEDGHLLDQTETVMHQRIIERMVSEGRVEDAAREINAYRVAGGDIARAFRARVDPLESPAKRAHRAVMEKLLEAPKAERAEIEAARKSGDKAKAKKLADQAAKKARQHLVEVAQKSGIDPMDLAGEKKPRRTAKEKVAAATVEVRREFGDLVKQLKESLRKPTSTGALGGEQADLIAKIIVNRIKAGLLKAADVALDIAKVIPRIKRDAAMQEAFASAWEKQTGEKVDREALFGAAKSERDKALEKLAQAAARHQQTPDERRAALEEKRSGKKPRDPEVQAILDTARELDAEVRKRDAASKPDPTLDQQVAAARDKLAKAIDDHAAAMGQSDAERKAALAARASKPSLPPEVQKLLDEAKALGTEVRKRDAALKPPPTLDEQLSAAREKLARAAEKHQAAAGQTDAERLAAIKAKIDAKESLHPEVQALHDTASELSRQVAARDRLIYRNALRVLDASRILKADGWDKFDELYRSGLHTSFGLPWYKVGADLVNKLHSFISDDLGAAIINHVIPGGSDPRSVADAPYILKAIIPSMVRGAQHGLESLREDRNVWADEVRAARAAKEGGINGLGEADEFHQQTHALGPVLHNAAGWNMRLIGAEQAAAESMFAHAQVAAEAHRLAVGPDGQRLTGQALHDFIHAQVEDLTSPAWTNAIEVAHRDTNVTQPSVLNPVYWVNKVKNANLRDNEAITSVPGAYPILRTAQSALRVVAPFTTVPANIVARGIYGMTPLNGVSIAARAARHALHLVGAPGGKAYARAQFNTDLSRHLLGWLAAAGIAYVMYDKDGKRRLTGYTYDKGAKDRGGPPEHAVLINGKWWDYSKIIGPAGHAVGMLADAFDAARSTVVPGAKVSPENALAGWFKTAKGHLVNESLMRGVSDIAAAVQSDSGFAKYVGTLGASFVPTEFHQASKALDNASPDHQAKERGVPARIAQVFRQQLGIHETPSVDVFGVEIPKDDPLNGPVTAPLARLLAPIHGKAASLGDAAQPYRDMIQRWNDANPGAKLTFGTPEPVVELGRKRVPLTPQQYHDLCVDAGERTMTLLRRMTLNTDEPTARDASALANAVKSAQAGAREAMKVRVAREAKPSD